MKITCFTPGSSASKRIPTAFSLRAVRMLHCVMSNTPPPLHSQFLLAFEAVFLACLVYLLAMVNAF